MLGLSSLLDAWIRLELHRQNSEFVRLIRMLKGRGAKTSQQIKEFRITETGIAIEDPYVGGGGFVFGTEKMIQEQKDQQAAAEQAQRLERLKTRVGRPAAHLRCPVARSNWNAKRPRPTCAPRSPALNTAKAGATGMPPWSARPGGWTERQRPGARRRHAGAPMPVLTLFVLGQTETVRRAIANASALGPVTIVDVREDPAAAEAARILATPTLVRMDESPARIAGDLSDMAAVRAHLGPPFDTPAPRKRAEAMPDLTLSTLALNHLAEGVLLLDAAGHTAYANQAAAAMFGRSAEALAGMPFSAPIRTDAPVELVILNAETGAEIIAEMQVVPLLAGDDTLSVVSLRDVTERQRAERQLREERSHLSIGHRQRQRRLLGHRPHHHHP